MQVLAARRTAPGHMSDKPTLDALRLPAYMAVPDSE
jgi:hypothetical protein